MSDTPSLSDQKKILEGQVMALGTELAQLATGHKESLLGMVVSHFVGHRTAQIQAALSTAKTQLDAVTAALAQVATPPPAAPSSPTIPGLTA